MAKKKWGWELEEAHAENRKLLGEIVRVLVRQCVFDGYPQQPSEVSKRMWIIVSGALERCNENLRGKNLD